MHMIKLKVIHNRHPQGHDRTKEYNKDRKFTKERVILLHKSHVHDVKNV
jgi:hypothetical protein